MKNLIFEGIATSGKSTLILALSSNDLIKDKTVVFEEKDTHLPIMKQTSDLHLEFFKELINKSKNMRKDIVIFDRLYLTQAFRANVQLTDYSEIEELLIPNSPTTIFLKVDESALSDRVMKAAEHRDPKWAEYIGSKGKTPEEIAQYYIEQQRNQLKLLEQSKLPYRIFNTTSHDYAEIENTIFREFLEI